MSLDISVSSACSGKSKSELLLMDKKIRLLTRLIYLLTDEVI